MPGSSPLFKRDMDKAIHRMSAAEGIEIGVLEDELGYALGHNGRSYIQHLRKGNLPLLEDCEKLARLLVQRQGLPDRRTCEKFLRNGRHPNPKLFAEQLFTRADTMPSSAPQTDTPSPFLYGPPVTQLRHFFGRERELTFIFDRWRRRYMEHVAIISPKRGGKSSLLHYLQKITTAVPDQLRNGQKQDWLAQPEWYTWVLVDFRDARMQRLDYLLRFLLTELRIPVPGECTLESFMETAVYHDWTRPGIILMDDIDAGLSAPGLPQTLWDSLRSLVSHHTDGRLAFGITARELPYETAARHGKMSNFFNLFQTTELGPLAEAEAQQLIHSANVPVSQENANWILQESGRWPALIQLLCQAHYEAQTRGTTDDDWRAEGLKRIAPNRHLTREG